MTISFKKYVDFMTVQEDPTDEQIVEIFGLFKNNQKIEKLKADREKLKQDTAKKVADWREKKELEKSEKEMPKNFQGKPNAAAAGRAAEKDWTSNMATEGRKSFVEFSMKQILDALGGKDKILSDFKGKTSEEVADALESAAYKLSKDSNAIETVTPEHFEFLDWADKYFDAA